MYSLCYIQSFISRWYYFSAVTKRNDIFFNNLLLFHSLFCTWIFFSLFDSIELVYSNTNAISFHDNFLHDFFIYDVYHNVFYVKQSKGNWLLKKQFEMWQSVFKSLQTPSFTIYIILYGRYRLFIANLRVRKSTLKFFSLLSFRYGFYLRHIFSLF